MFLWRLCKFDYRTQYAIGYVYGTGMPAGFSVSVSGRAMSVFSAVLEDIIRMQRLYSQRADIACRES